MAEVRWRARAAGEAMWRRLDIRVAVGLFFCSLGWLACLSLVGFWCLRGATEQQVAQGTVARSDRGVLRLVPRLDGCEPRRRLRRAPQAAKMPLSSSGIPLWLAGKKIITRETRGMSATKYTEAMAACCAAGGADKVQAGTLGNGIEAMLGDLPVYSSALPGG